MINRQAVLEYLTKHPNHSTWQMRLHFLQAIRQRDCQSQISIGSIANQLNYILRDLEAIGTLPSCSESSCLDRDGLQRESQLERYAELNIGD
ncbi:hypothetical protein [Chamaesiphon polymorphus]|uniref:Transcriptional regulator n=1 Tax=Chamaesiphon polymorphus CCALA 037 TaxID=2107692 RepID=A0A2T1GNL7_9CYAN|nr:hypothetical protein [Chamaesiphon polymorphus]PSB59528.1 hypothetical protein C7B77_00610 [Chamaesiphon polymorphus CCALA 037]